MKRIQNPKIVKAIKLRNRLLKVIAFDPYIYYPKIPLSLDKIKRKPSVKQRHEVNKCFNKHRQRNMLRWVLSHLYNFYALNMRYRNLRIKEMTFSNLREIWWSNADIIDFMYEYKLAHERKVKSDKQKLAWKYKKAQQAIEALEELEKEQKNAKRKQN